MFANSSLVAHSERPSDEEDTWEDNLCWKFIPPRADVLGVADEEGPLAMIFDVEVVVDAVLKSNDNLRFFFEARGDMPFQHAFTQPGIAFKKSHIIWN